MTDVLDLILQRQSHARLQEPAPAGEDLELILACGLRAPDHALLRPSRFLLIAGDGRIALGEAFVKALLEDKPDAGEAEIEKARTKGMRAPLVIVGVTGIREHAKVPPIEQKLSTGVALGYMLLALEAKGFGGIWRTGNYAYHPRVSKELGLAENETITGFLYAGTPVGNGPEKARPEPGAVARAWPDLAR